MSRPNIETVLSVYDALSRGDTDTIAAFAAPEIEIHQSTELPWGGVYSGTAQAMAFFGKVTSFVEARVTVERMLDAGDCVAVVGRTAGTIRATSTPFDVPLVHLWEVCGGKVTRLEVFLDNLSMLPGVVCALPAAA